MSVLPLIITAHIENQGDVTVSGPQQFVGTKGQSRRLEGFMLSAPAGVELEYMAHIENQGDTHWHRSGQFCGTKGMSRRLEGFAIRVVGAQSAYYDVKYYAHIQDQGDSAVQANGGFAGTRGQSRRVEGMSAWLEARAPAYTPQPAYVPQPAYPAYPAYPSAQPVYPAYPSVPAYPAYPTPSYPAAPPPLTVTAYCQHQGPMTVYGQQFAGTKGQSRKLEAFSLTAPPGVDIEYMAHIENRGDTHWHRNGELVGHQGGGRIEGFAVRICGPAANSFDVKYYGHIENQGDSPVQQNGSFCGTRGQSKRCEGICVWLEPRRY